MATGIELNKVLVESSLVVLTSKEGAAAVARAAGSAFRGIQDEQDNDIWTAGSPPLFGTEESMRIAPWVLVFGSNVDLGRFERGIEGSRFLYSLYHYRRPGQPIGTDPKRESDKAAMKAAAAAPKAPAARIVAGPAGVPFPISPNSFTGIRSKKGATEIQYRVQRTRDGKFYANFEAPEGNAYKPMRIEGASEQEVRDAMKKAQNEYYPA